jgi:hypothetical protein
MMEKRARDYVGEDKQQLREQRGDNQRIRDPVDHAQREAMTVRRGDAVNWPRLWMAYRVGHLEEQRRGGALSVMAGLVPAVHAVKRDRRSEFPTKPGINGKLG